jgi:hypothetical protein
LDLLLTFVLKKINKKIALPGEEATSHIVDFDVILLSG